MKKMTFVAGNIAMIVACYLKIGECLYKSDKLCEIIP